MYRICSLIWYHLQKTPVLLSETKSRTMMPGSIKIKVETNLIRVNPVITDLLVMFQWMLLFVGPLLTVINDSTRWNRFCIIMMIVPCCKPPAVVNCDCCLSYICKRIDDSKSLSFQLINSPDLAFIGHLSGSHQAIRLSCNLFNNIVLHFELFGFDAQSSAHDETPENTRNIV